GSKKRLSPDSPGCALPGSGGRASPARALHFRRRSGPSSSTSGTTNFRSAVTAGVTSRRVLIAATGRERPHFSNPDTSGEHVCERERRQHRHECHPPDDAKRFEDEDNADNDRSPPQPPERRARFGNSRLGAASLSGRQRTILPSDSRI